MLREYNTRVRSSQSTLKQAVDNRRSWLDGLFQFRHRFHRKPRYSLPFDPPPSDAVEGRKNAGLLTNFDRHGRDHRFKPASGLGAKAKYAIAYGLRSSHLLQHVYQIRRTI